MDFRILGPLEVDAGEGPVSVGGAKPRAVLAMLLLHANKVVSSDRLIDALWGERPPATALKALQVHVSQLRKAIGASVVQTRPPGYVLEVGAGDLDLDRFMTLREEARLRMATAPAEAGRILDEALTLWRGPALGDFSYEPFAQPEIARLEELRVAALEDRLDTDLALGRASQVVGELEVLIKDHPLRERLRAQHMLALYRCGRQAEALEAYADARADLTEGLGIEPGRELRDLQRAILNQDPELDLRRFAGAETEEPARRVFVGRERERTELDRALSDALRGRGRIVLLVGEPGIGKSRLAEELMGQARARGARVLVGRCWEAGGAPAYWPWVQSLRAHISETDVADLRDQLGAGAADLAQLLPELRDLFDLPGPAAPDSEGARFRLFEAVCALLRGATRTGPIVLVLDDLHAADEPSLLMLRFLARATADTRLLVLGAYRDVDPTVRAPLEAALAELVREPQTMQITLDGLTDSQLAEYIELATGVDPAPGLAEAIRDETEGNPLFATEVVRLLHAEGRIGEPDAQHRIPPGIRAVIGQRVGRLSQDCRAVLTSACVLGREFALEPLVRFTGLERDEMLELLDEAMADRLVGEVPSAPGRLRFGHAIIRDTLYEELTPARRRQLHRDAAEALEEAYAADIEPHLSELTQHHLAAASEGTTEKAAEYARRAGDRAASLLAYEEAVRLYEMALTVVDDPDTRCRLLLAIGDAQARAGATPASNETLREAAELAERLGVTEYLVRAALGYGGRFIWEASRGDDSHVPLLERALAALGPADSTHRVRLLARMAAGPLRQMHFPVERRLAASDEALAMARRIADPATLAFALSGYNAANHSPQYTPRQVEVATEAIQVAMEVGDRERAHEGHEHRAMALVELGEMRRAKADFAAMAKLADELRQPSQDWFVAVYSAEMALLEGKFAEAERLSEVARGVGENMRLPHPAVSHALQLYLLRRERGRIEQVEEVVRRAAEENPSYAICRCALTQLAAQLGLDAEACSNLEALAADRFAGLPFDSTWLVNMGLLAETASALRDAAHAAVLYELLCPYSDRVAVAYAEFSLGSVARHLGLLATLMERWDEAERHFDTALEMNGRIEARSWKAHTQRDYARMLLARDAPGDANRAEALLAEALTTYRQLGMGAYAASASQEFDGAA